MIATEDYVSNGETRRAIVAGIMPIGDSAVVEFAEWDRPGTVHRAAVLRCPASDGLAVGDECVIRYQLGRNLAHPSHWELVERLGPSSSAPIPAPAPIVRTEREIARAAFEAARKRQLEALALVARARAPRVEPSPEPVEAEPAVYVRVESITHDDLMTVMYA
jgi:hypothetical protein